MLTSRRYIKKKKGKEKHMEDETKREMQGHSSIHSFCTALMRMGFTFAVFGLCVSMCVRMFFPVMFPVLSRLLNTKARSPVHTHIILCLVEKCVGRIDKLKSER